MIVLAYLYVAFFCGLFGLVAGTNRGRPGFGFVLGFAFPVLGNVWALFLDPDRDSPFGLDWRLACGNPNEV